MEIEKSNKQDEFQIEMLSDIHSTKECRIEGEYTGIGISSVNMSLKGNAVTFIPVHSNDLNISESSSDLVQENSDLEIDTNSISYMYLKSHDEDNYDLESDDADPCITVKNEENGDYDCHPNFSFGGETLQNSNSSILKHSKKGVEALKCKKCELSFSKQHEYSQHLLNDHHNDTKGTFACGTCQKVFKLEVSLHYHMAQHFSKSSLFSCTKCTKKFNNESALSRHMKTHEENETDVTFGINVCSICSAEFDCEITYKQHLLSHCNMENFSCGFCNKKYENLNKLKCHLRFHLRTFECTICGQIFKSRGNLNRHLGIHTGEREYACSHCDTDFRDNRDLQNHLHRKHPEIYGPLPKKEKRKQKRDDPEKPWKCEHCGKAFRKSSILNDHITANSVCSICSAEFPCENTYREHLLTHCDVDRYVCCLCSKQLNNLVKLKYHLRFHILTYACSVCGRIFTRKDNLNRHLAVHNGERKYACSHCDADFRENKNLKIHFHRKHPEIYGPLLKKQKRYPEKGDHKKPWKCEFCGRCFRYRSILIDHTMSHTGDHPRAVFCPVCDKKFIRNSKLKLHINRVHAEHKVVSVKRVLEDRYFCEVCGKGFHYPSDHKRHLECHSSIRNVCELCGQGFKLKNELVNHKAKEHSSEESEKEKVCEMCGHKFVSVKGKNIHLPKCPAKGRN